MARRLPLILIGLAAIAGFVLLRDKISFQVLADHSADLTAFRQSHFALASLAFIALYVLAVGISMPGASIISMTGGFLFGLFPGVIYNIAAATAGGTLVYLAARAGFGDDLAGRLERRGGRLAQIQDAVAKNQWSAMMSMRLLPVLPFFLVNLVAASVGVRFWPFVVTTLVGIIPGALVFTAIGSGLGEVLARGETPDAGVLFRLPILLPLLGLALLAALPMLASLRKGKQDRHDPNHH